jgi:ABC-type phosphate/phosphonate transport system substrate-binding protein
MHCNIGFYLVSVRLRIGRAGLRRIAAAVAIACAVGCAEERRPNNGPLAIHEPASDAAALREIRFGVQPIQDSRLLWSRWNGLIAELTTSSAFRFRLESALSEPTYHARVAAGELDVVLVEPHRVVGSESLGYRVFARVAAQDRIGGVLVVRSDAPLTRPRSLGGKRLAFSHPDALASTMLVRQWLREEAGLNLRRSCAAVYVGSEDAALRAVANGDADAAGVSRAAWERLRDRYPHWAEVLEARWATDTLSGPALMAHKRLSDNEVRQLREAFVSLARTDSGRAAIARTGYHGFRAASASSYDDVWEFVAYYARVFGKCDAGAGG